MEIEINQEDNKKSNKDYYFDSYDHIAIHEEMLQDQVRTGSYYKAIVKNKHLFKDKVVMDVGCGTGILSLFAASAGAKLVIGIDNSDIIFQAEKIIKANNFSHIIKLIKNKIEDIQELPDKIEKVDIIVSEWMGYCLFFENMLESVIFARDKWLAKDGLMFPDKFGFFLAGIENPNFKPDKIDFWKDVYGFDMTCFQDLVYLEPSVEAVDPETIVTNTILLKEIDTQVLKKEDISLKSSFILTTQKNCNLNGLVAFFTTTFSKCHKKVHFSTGPLTQQTHWRQSVFYLEEEINLKRGKTFRGVFSLFPNAKNSRDLDISIEYKTEPQKIFSKVQNYRFR
ncbi:protein arginine n-methyltransferase 3 [Anaeramoeba ignava]|uniref:type I protein arginine methyltransferase n=1 Tax=Anaeramoeba ignava TaxID=1746090 RepID=A0A9Q0LSB7_ANAIG|nr:protein arginine n-methyltransferase 3 [Anaeramoeba ignava]